MQRRRNRPEESTAQHTTAPVNPLFIDFTAEATVPSVPVQRGLPNGHSYYNPQARLQQDQGFRSYTPPAPESAEEQAPEMNPRDRTEEFRRVCQYTNGPAAPHQSALRDKSLFTKAARKIGRDLSSSLTKLEQLTILAKKRSLFDDKSDQISQLTNVIKQDIAQLNKDIQQLQQISKQATNPGNQSHSNSVVVGLQSKLANMSTSFKSVLEQRTQNLKAQQTRRQEFSHGVPAGAFPTESSSLLADDDARASRNGDVTLDLGSNFQQMALIEQQDTYLADRASTMQSIEQTIVELGGIFTQLAHMVKEQEELVQRIDTNVEETSLNVEAAHQELLKYFQGISSNRWLMIKIFGILIVFFIIFTVFMA